MRWRDFSSLAPLPDSFFDRPRRVHFIGAGGIGMSALAFALKARGHHVSGSDATPGGMAGKLQAAGITMAKGHTADNLQILGAPAEAVIFGSAIAPENAERQAAQERNIPQWHRAQLLAWFVNNAAYSIAVSGTHGKSTTSAMIAHILTKCGKNPTALLGAEYPPFGSNVWLGDPDLVVVEADESDGSFTLLKPSVAVVTNVEPEHLENYDDSEDELWRAFEMFVAQARDVVVLNSDDTKMLGRLANSKTQRLICYESNDGPHRQNIKTVTIPDNRRMLRASNTIVSNRQTRFDLQHSKHRRARHNFGQYSLGCPGRHNLSNALAAIAASTTVDLAEYKAAHSLADFHGVARRFQFVGEANGILIYDDYAHHPTEVESTLQTAREFLQRPVVAVFQPHRYSRTAQMGAQFGPSFEAADRIIITQLYSAFEEPIAGVSGRIVFDSVRAAFPDKPISYAETLDEARCLAVETVRPGDAIICMGAGDIGAMPALLLRDLQSAAEPKEHDERA